jgi:ubiquitin carboxyl-terminal hydrolase 10
VHVAAPPSPELTTFTPFYPPLPWLSVPDADFPARAAGRRRRKRGLVPAQEQGLALPSRGQDVQEDVKATDETTAGELESAGEPEESQASTTAVPSDAEVDTPSTSHPPSEIDAASVHQLAAQTTAPAQKHTRNATKPAVPLIPIKQAKAVSAASVTQKSVTSPSAEKPQSKPINEVAASASEAANVEEAPKPTAPAAPKSWAELLRAKNAAAAPQAQSQAQPPVISNGIANTNGPAPPKSNSLSDVLASYSVEAEKKVAFIEPRGLVNTGNLCYMNSVLQVLLFCAPFYDFLDQTAKRAVHSFKSETPLVDAMIMFLRDFKVIDSASSVEQLRLRLKTEELEQFGDPLTPDYVYETIRRLPRFDNMKRGSQEDAEEFLGFLLAGLHDDCALVIKKGNAQSASSKTEESNSADGEWLEVTAKQKTSVTQSSGTVEVETPITKIFGGKLRSEYRKAGQKPSVTFEPYQPLQLDIGEPHINNISDALKNLTRLETLDSAASGARASTKQVHIETLPPVLILHLKRFHYDEKGPQKIWKKIGYPLELEIPKEAFPQHKRGGFQAQGGFPRYRLTGVVYHHGKNASGGHYTVDLRRQEGREWIRMDDTVIRRVRAEDVAEGGAEEDPKLLAAALEQHKNDSGKSKNFFAQIDVDEETSDKGGWNQVNGTDKKDNTKKWAGVVNGTATPNSAGKRTPLPKENVRDNKVAYILFYQRIES